MTDELLPKHIGLIIDGNRRWAKSKGLPSFKGHEKGYETLRMTLSHAVKRGIKFVSVFAFSTENWNRTKQEVSFLLDFAEKAILKEVNTMQQNGIQFVWLGSEEGISERLAKTLRQAEKETANNTRCTLGLCLNYGGQREIVDAVRSIVREGVASDDVTEELIAGHLYGPDIPPIDLLIRTSSEQRISNFMLWRAAYSELKFIDKFWPDYTPADLDEAISDYASRNRRFGG